MRHTPPAPRFVVRPLDVSFYDLPDGLAALRIIQQSDLHIGPHTSKRHLERIAEAVHSARPDLIVMTGDQVDDFSHRGLECCRKRVDP